MSFSRFFALLAVGCLLVLSLHELANAQIVRRFAGGGVQVNAPFVRVNVGPGGATSVRAPFVAVDRQGRTFLGRRRRLMSPPLQPTPQQNATRYSELPTQRPALQPAPDVADVDALPYPTARQLAAMEDGELVETLRQMMARLQYRLSLLTTGEGWQKYLVLSREALGSPGAPPAAAHFDAVQKILPRYQSVQDDPQFLKIATLPSFVASFATLQEVDRRFGGTVDSYESDGPEITDPNNGAPPADEAAAEEPLEILPTPQSIAVPNATRGERSILKRK